MEFNGRGVNPAWDPSRSTRWIRGSARSNTDSEYSLSALSCSLGPVGYMFEPH